MAILSNLKHPLTGAVVELFDPAEHETAAWKAVTCTDCLRHYVCAPWDDYDEPPVELGWRNGKVCDHCMLTLHAARVTS